MRESSQETDYGTVYTYTLANGSGEIGESIEYKYGEALAITTKTSLNVAPTMAATLISSSVQDTDFGQIYTYKFAEGEGQINASEEKKYNNVVTVYTHTHINEVPSPPGTEIKTDIQQGDYGEVYTTVSYTGEGKIEEDDVKRYNDKLTIRTISHIGDEPIAGSAYVMQVTTKETDYGTITTKKLAEGEGEIDKFEAKKYNDVITVTTRVHLNEVPTVGSENIISEKVESGDFGTLHTTVSYSGEGEIQKDESKKYNNKLTITTLAHINEDVEVPGTAYLMKTDLIQSDYGEITRKTFAEGEGIIAESDRSRTVGSGSMTGEIVERRETHLNPESDPDDPADHILINKNSTSGDFGEIIEYIWVKGNGVIRKTTESRSDGSVVTTIVAADDSSVENEVNGDVGTDVFLASEEISVQQGYDITTYKYYSLPSDYNVPYSIRLNEPDEIIADEDGVYIGDPGSSKPCTGTSSVSFSIDVPEVKALSDFEPALTVVERAVYSDGSILANTATYRNAYSAQSSLYTSASNNSSSPYREKNATNVTVNAYGTTDGNPFTGTLTVGFEVVPYLTIGGITVYKTTESTVSASGGGGSSGSSGSSGSNDGTFGTIGGN